MAGSNPPPQAYTKETVSQAYEWLFEQPPSVREVAGDLDTMVALFLQAKRRKAGVSSTNPVSAKAFKDELKGLAENFKQFEPAKVEPEPVMPAQQMPLPPQPPAQSQQPVMPPAPQPQPMMSFQRPPTPPSSSLAQLDEKSLQQIRHVMGHLNLSSESETLRLLISLGYEKVREILPKS